MMATRNPAVSNRKARAINARSVLSSRQPVTASTSQPAVVIEFGNGFIRAGFAGEATPRCILKSSIPLLIPTDLENMDPSFQIAQKTEEEWEMILTPLLDNICVDRLLVRPRNHRMLLLEPIIAPTSFRQAITKVLLKTMQAPSLLFISDPAVCTLHAHGLKYGLVLDMGRFETRTVGSFNGRSLPNTFQAVPTGYESVLAYFQENYNINSGKQDEEVSTLCVPDLKDAHFIMQQCLSKLSTQIDSNIILDCTVPSTQKRISVSSTSIIDAWKNTCFDIFNPKSVTFAFLSTILAAPIDLRKVLLKNICIVGGGPSMLQSTPSFFSNMLFNSFNIDTLQLNENSQFQSLIPCLTTTELQDSNSLFQKGLMNWIGASILGTSLELNDERWVHKNVYFGDEGDATDEEELSVVDSGTGDGDIVFDWMQVGK